MSWVICSTWVTVFCIFFLKGMLALDPDFGWHIQVGEYIFRHGLPRIDMYSYTMPSYPFIDHEWLTDFSMAWIYKTYGLVGLSFLFAGISTSALYVSVRIWQRTQLIPLQISLLFASSVVLSEFAGIRPQVITWLFLVGLWYLISYRVWVAIPPLFAIWANLHGGFSIGMVAIVVFFFFRSFQKHSWKSVASSFLIVCVSYLFTLINPYGVRIWSIVFDHLLDGRQRWTIAEWQPMYVQVDPTLLLLISLSFVVLVKYMNLYQKYIIAIFFLFFFASISSLRHIPLWVLIALPIIVHGIGYFSDTLPKDQGTEERKQKVFSLFTIVVLCLSFAQWGYLIARMLDYRELSFYPAHAVSYIKAFPSEGRLFSSYSWGGYLIGEMPEIKLFVDGRMPTWRYSGGGEEDSRDAFGDYLDIVGRKTHTASVMEDWGIDTVLWFSKDLRQQDGSPTLFTLLRGWWNNRVGEDERAKKHFLQDLQEASWKIVYQDHVSVILKKP